MLRGVLNRLFVLDQEPPEFESTLLTILGELDEPSGSTRAVCTAIVQKWEMARLRPAFWPFRDCRRAIVTKSHIVWLPLNPPMTLR